MYQNVEVSNLKLGITVWWVDPVVNNNLQCHHIYNNNNSTATITINLHSNSCSFPTIFILQQHNIINNAIRLINIKVIKVDISIGINSCLQLLKVFMDQLLCRTTTVVNDLLKSTIRNKAMKVVMSIGVFSFYLARFYHLQCNFSCCHNNDFIWS